MLSATALACGHPFFFTGWERQSPVATWKYVHNGQHNATRTFASKKTQRKRGNFQNKSKGPTFVTEEASSLSEGSAGTSLHVDNKDFGRDDYIPGAPRSAVLEACIFTSVLLFVGGLVLRQASHFASLNGWSVADPADVSFNFEIWHLELVAGIIILISSSRYILLQTWPEFRDSSEAANSQELLFRGALMPTFGLNWISALIIGAVFGVLHLGNGRRYSFTIWATFVGFAYGMGTIASSSVIVPMVAHSLNNIIGGFLWRFTSNSQKSQKDI